MIIIIAPLRCLFWSCLLQSNAAVYSLVMSAEGHRLKNRTIGQLLRGHLWCKTLSCEGDCLEVGAGRAEYDQMA